GGGPTNKETDEGSKYDDEWLLIARDAYTEAESYYDANIRSTHERNISHFSNRHAPGSKYYTEGYKFRKKSFRPKTRSMVRRQESALLKAMFSTADFVKVKAARTQDPAHRVSAEINQELLQYRLENTIPWFLTALGAYQETLNVGVCISHQFWDYEEEGQGFEEEEESTPDAQYEIEGLDEAGDNVAAGTDTEGNPFEKYFDEDSNVIKADFGGPRNEIVRDTPAVELRPVENVYFSVACDWRDPANTSPFIIDKMPMYIDEVKAMSKPRAGSPMQPWYPLTESQLLAGLADDYDPVRRQREENREDSKDQRHLHRGFDTVWVHRNIVRKQGRDWVYYTLGVHYRLSDPVPLRQEYPWLKPGERPYVIGFSNVEAHKNYPESLVGLSSGTQQKANELDNTRGDNVELSLNRRYIVKRAAMIDYRGLQRNVPGGVTETDDPNNDIRIEQPPDVTGSSYQEQDRINADFDELVGMFSGSSVANNRSMNETVGGMKLLAGDADSLTEYPLMVFMITWVLPVLKQVVRLEQTHESDPALLNLIGEKIKFWQRYKVEGEQQRITDAWIQGSMNLQLSAGMGATNPEQQIQRLAAGFGIIFQMAPALAQRLDGEEVAKEVMGAMGYRGIDRFFPESGPKIPGMQPPPNEGDMTEQDQAKLDQDFKKDQAVLEQKERQMQWDIEKFYAEMENKAEERLLKKEISQQQYEEKMKRIDTDRQNKVDEMRMKIQTGQQGI
ncbi:MAG: hypothetical protein OER43_19030, partial [Gammaproteobacteria bacterium]|nr:hypothetical protein [Gammaproteobacteria bacterium]